MRELYDYLGVGKKARTLDQDEEKLARKFLRSHEIHALSRRAGFKVFQSYLENRTPAAGRLFWAYGPERGQIAVLGLEPHPEDTRRGYTGIRLSGFPS